jgi:hypothetical protein
LLRPDHPGERLALDIARVGFFKPVLECSVEGIRFLDALGKNGFKRGEYVSGLISTGLKPGANGSEDARRDDWKRFYRLRASEEVCP